MKILSIHDKSTISIKGYNLYRTSHDTSKVDKIASISDGLYSVASQIRPIARFLRAEITGAYNLQDDSILAVAKKGLYKLSKGEKRFKKTFSVPRGSKPLNLCILPNGHIFFGEYFQNMEKVAVNVYGSVDDGETWKVVHTFEAGNINHIHGLFYDHYTDRMWVLTGDRENECIIGYTDDEFKSFHEVLRGGQEYRSCQLFFYPDFIVYATDSQYIENEIRAIDRKTLDITPLAKIQGSAIKGSQTGDVSYLATTVEPSEVNKDRFSHIWLTKDGRNWKDVFKAEKDCWPSIMQYGTFEFPQNAYCNGKLWFSGRSLKGFDAKTSFVEI